MLVFLVEAVNRTWQRDLEWGPLLQLCEVAADSPWLVSAPVEMNN